MPAAYHAPALVLGSPGKQPLSCEEAGNYPWSVGCFVGLFFFAGGGGGAEWVLVSARLVSI